MEELWELRRHIDAGDHEAALALLDEMGAMARDDKITRIESCMQVLLLQLMKQAIEHRMTKSLDVFILNACEQIRRLNKRRKAGGWYLSDHELYEALEEVYDTALRRASLEACEGIYTAEQLAAMHERHQVLHDAWAKIRHMQHEHDSSA
jgi:hypothetical protein